MLGLNNHIPTMVYTQRGLIDIADALYGDVVIEYGSNKHIKVLDVTTSNSIDLYEVTYTDGRKSIYKEDDLILSGNQIVPVKDIINSSEFKPIPLQEVEFQFSKITKKVFPDPYITGALILHGRYDTPYLNLPLDRNAADRLFAHKYHLDFADKLEDNTTFYRWNGNSGDQLITWKEFFPCYDFYITSENITSPLIPLAYTRGSILDRKKFVRGVFDVGYNCDIFPDSIGIASIWEDRLKEFQKILWSLGIVSYISYDPKMPRAQGRLYRLDVLGDYDNYPGLFYDINSIEKSIINETKRSGPYRSFEFKIKSITKIKQNGCPIDRGFMSNLILEKSNVLYVTENFIPRISL